MRVTKFMIVVFALLSLQFSVFAQDSEQLFTIYLMRHAEKELTSNNPKDPPLTPCGENRAKSITSFLDSVDLEAVYSTEYIRTMKTALPTATKKGLEIESYNPKELNDFAKLLLNRKQDALVVGHSNTTGVLAGLLAGEKIGSFDEKIYNRVYQVVMYKDKGRLHILHTSFNCDSD